MAGYPKLWTTIRHEPWFRRLSATQKCIWYEMILIAKEQKDNGEITFKNVSHMAAEVGTDRRSIEKWLSENCAEVGEELGKGCARVGEELGKSCVEGRVRLVEKSPRLLHFVLTKYNDSQRVKRFVVPKNTPVSKAKQSEAKQSEINTCESKDSRALEKNRGKKKSSIKEKSTTADKPARADKSEHHRIIKYWTDEYISKFGVKYNFTAKDAKLIQRLLKTYEYDTLKIMMNNFLQSDDEFYRKSGHTIGVLSACSNKIAQQSEKERKKKQDLSKYDKWDWTEEEIRQRNDLSKYDERESGVFKMVYPKVENNNQECS